MDKKFFTHLALMSMADETEMEDVVAVVVLELFELEDNLEVSDFEWVATINCIHVSTEIATITLVVVWVATCGFVPQPGQFCL